MSELCLEGGRVVDPSQGLDEVADVLLRDGKVAQIGRGIGEGLDKGVERLDVRNLVVCPGLIDIHVHLRQPGQTAKETLATGAMAAARGGFTTIVCMPNTSPAIDNSGTVALIHERAKETAVRIEVAGAITKNIAGEELAPIASLARAGVVAITDDGKCVQHNELMRRALEYAGMFGLIVMDHCQDYSLVDEGVMHEGYWSAILGLQGWPSAGEEMIVARNILLAEQTGTHVHCQHISATGSVRLLREAKDRGVPISGEACPHHFTLTDACVAGASEFWRSDGEYLQTRFFGNEPRPDWPAYHSHFKMNPPLRSAADRESILKGLADGTLEIIASDHAPHTESEKEVEFDHAPFGITGLEVELPLALMQLVHANRLRLSDLIAKFTINPARILRLKDGRGTLRAGAPADVTVLDPEYHWVRKRHETASKSQNDPFDGWCMRGKAMITIVKGKVVWKESVVPKSAR